MNHTYKTIYDSTKGTYVAVAEIAKSRTKSGSSIKKIALCLALSTLPAISSADTITIEGDYVRTAVSDQGTLGSNGANPPGMQYDKNGTRNFGIDDYLTPGTPFQIFSVKTNETGLQTNNNTGSQAISTVSGPTDTSTGTVSSATWSGKHLDYYTVKNDYSVDKTEQGIRVETTLTASQDLTGVKFATALDPDPDVNTYHSYHTTNGRGTSKFAASDWVHSLGKQTGLPVGIYSTSAYTHNTGVSSGWSTDPDFYLSGKMDGDGDYTIGMGFDIGTLNRGKSANLVYYYLMGEKLDDVVAPPSSKPSTPSAKSNIDLRKPYYEGYQLGITVNPVFEGGTLNTDKAGMYASNFTINKLGGKINTAGNISRFTGIFSNFDSSDSGDFTVKDDVGGGSVTFEAPNSYSGKTIIDGTTLALSKTGSIASSRGVDLTKSSSVFDVSGVTGSASTIQNLNGISGSTVQTGETVLTAGTVENTEFAGSFTGNGGYIKAGSGRMLLSGDSNGFTGVNSVNGGELRVNGILGGRSLNIASDTVLSGKGTVGGTVTAQSGSNISPGSDSQDTLTLSGNLEALTGSSLSLQTTLGGDDSSTDRLAVTGNTSGNAVVKVSNMGGNGAKTKEGIKVIDVDGSSDAVFTMSQPLTVDSYEYRLVKNGLATPTDGDWYLRNTYRSGIANYLVAAAANTSGSFELLSTMHQRNGTLKSGASDTQETWARLIGSRDTLKGSNQFEYKQNLWGMQIGKDLWRSGGDNRSRFGLSLQYLRGDADAYDNDRRNVGLSTATGKVKSHTGGIGIYHTAVGKQDWYVDTVAQVNRISNTLTDTENRSSKFKGTQVGLSVEAGKAFALSESWKIEPQAQLSYLYTRYSKTHDNFANVKVHNPDSLRLRLGTRVNKHITAANKDMDFYALANLQHEFNSTNKATFNHASGNALTVDEKFKRSGIEAGMGMQVKVGSDSHLYSDLRHLHLFGNKGHETRFNVGLKTKF
ncbi:autotransporter outer membrane beta-barrel domain-containing protein [Neisseria sp. CCUG12390]|uniref:autotransporter outer membrane beta-barrel domain-containing protein n=1 Tax=Neisseria sp. CCUG12390 TaxID=3392035 RepID=UPI003A0FCE06